MPSVKSKQKSFFYIKDLEEFNQNVKEKKINNEFITSIRNEFITSIRDGSLYQNLKTINMINSYIKSYMYLSGFQRQGVSRNNPHTHYINSIFSKEPIKETIREEKKIENNKKYYVIINNFLVCIGKFQSSQVENGTSSRGRNYVSFHQFSTATLYTAKDGSLFMHYL